MKIVLQKVSHASVITNELFNEIGTGYMLLVGVSDTSSKKDAETLAKKIIKARNFEDEDGKINLSLSEVGGDILSISQFTLYADVKKGNRPSFTHTADKNKAKELYDYFNELLRSYNITVKPGFFGQQMDVRLTNEGPITFIYESHEGQII